ncbi:MAG: FG-GAP-like repeat-containing protein, partial [Hyphomicrobium aestuarii]|nr:FG-GAP-like repeat-containing protein [Hyphomicrobium aestuarii]
MAINGSYGAEGTVYSTSFEEFSKVVSTGTAGNGPEKFTVWKKSGAILEYGFTTDSRIMAKGANAASARVWALNKLSDRVGNYINFIYFNDSVSGEFGIEKVEYTGNATKGLSPYNRVDFIYATAPKPVIGYANGEQYTQTKRLTNAKVFAEGALFRDYRLAYRSDFQLDTLTECAGTTCFAPTTFEWMYDENIAPGANNLFKTSALASSGITGSAYSGYSVAGSGDFNGDGLTDLYMMKVDASGRRPSSGAANEHIWLGKSDGTFQDIDLGTAGSLPNDNYKVVASGDFNGDGRTDLYVMRVQNDGASRATNNPNDRVLLGQANGSFIQVDLGSAGLTPANYKVASSGDFNGDGRTDLYFFASKSNGKTTGDAADYVLLASGGGFFNKINLTSSGLTGAAAYDEYDVVSGGDYNGDGLIDLYLMRISTKQGGVKSGSQPDYVWLADGAGSFTTINLGASFVQGTTGGTGSTPIGFKIGSSGDFNGDGHTDLYLFKADDDGRSVGNADDYVRFSKGDGYFEVKLLAGGMTGSAYDAYNVVSSGDYNSDGLTDLYVLRSDTKGRKTGNSADHVWLAKGDGEFIDIALVANTVDEQTQQLSVSSAPVGYRVATSGDINGDGLTDLYLLKTDDEGRSNGNPADYVFYGDYKQKELIKSITNGLGNKAEVEYLPLTDPAVYTKGAGAVFPVADVAGASYVVSKVKADNGLGAGVNTQTYTYEGLRTHQEGIGNLGFAKMTVMDDATGIASESVYSQDYAARTHGLMTQARTIAPGGVVLENKTVSWTAQSKTTADGTPHYFRFSTQSVTEKRDLNNASMGTVTEKFLNDADQPAYDLYGFVTQLSVITAHNGQTFTKKTLNTYSHNATDWILGRLTASSVTHSVTGVTPAPAPITRTSSFTYDAATGLIASETVEPGNALTHTKTYQYDGAPGARFGAVTSLTETWGSTGTDGIGATSRATSYVYDAKHRYKETETNPLGHVQTTQYHPLHGLPTQTTGPNGLMTSWTYDAFGQVTQELRADGTTTNTYRYKCDANTPCPTNGSYVVATVSTGAPLAAVYMDKLHRAIRKTGESLDGSLVDVDTVYDALGREEMVSEPYFGGGSPLWTTVVYDILGRPTLTTRPDLSTQSMVYNGLTQVSTNELAQTKTVVNDPLGRMLSSTDTNGETVSYRYDAIGQMTAIIDPAGNTTTMTYDVRGNKTAMSDPDKGNWSYRTNALGLLVEQTDAKGQRTEMTYDVLGRMLTRVDDAGSAGAAARTSTWVYDTAAMGVGKLASSSGYGYAASNLYDSLGRPSSATETIDGTGYTTTTTYDASGRPYRTAYASGLTVESVFNAYGHSTQMQNVVSGLVYWRADAADARGNITQSTLGAGVANVVEERFYNP